MDTEEALARAMKSEFDKDPSRSPSPAEPPEPAAAPPRQLDLTDEAGGRPIPPGAGIADTFLGSPVPLPKRSSPRRRARRQRGRIGVLRPLRHPDFAILWAGVAISLLGDGIYLVALPFLVLGLSNVPTALSVVGLALTLPQIVFPLVGGVVTDRFDRRRVLIAADLLRMAAIGAVGALALTGSLELVHVIALTVVYGIGESFFMPAFQAIIPEVVPDQVLLEANSLNQFSRPLMFRLLGPAVGGVLVALFEPGGAIVVDAATFGVSAAAVFFVRARPQRGAVAGTPSMGREIREGFSFVRSQPWLWASMLAAAVGLLAYWGPFEVLVPYIVKNRLQEGAGSFGLVIAAGGVGAILAAVIMGQRGLPRHCILFTYGSWALGTVLMATYSLGTETWQIMVTTFFMFGLFTAGVIVWSTLMHKLVPANLLGRVASFDWMVSSALLPLSFVVTGILAESIGVGPTLVGSGLLGCASVLVFLLVPGVRDAERDVRLSSQPLLATSTD